MGRGGRRRWFGRRDRTAGARALLLAATVLPPMVAAVSQATASAPSASCPASIALQAGPARARTLPVPAGQAALALEDVRLGRPIPGPVVPPPGYRRALEKGTRSADGAPGPNYWQVLSHYDIDVRLDPRTALLSGSERIRFENRSPDELRRIALQLYQNIHRAGSVRNNPVEITGGVTLDRVAAGGVELFTSTPRPGEEEPAPGVFVAGTVAWLTLPEPVPAGGSVELDVAWSFTVPARGAGRMGQSAHEVYFVGYWFPKIAVYDDLRGWDADPYLGQSEFYDSYADYVVDITVPDGWTVMATGVLENPEEVLSEQTRSRLAEAAGSHEPVVVASAEDREQNAVTAHPPSGTLTYRFRAANVRDFTWTASNVQVWQATTARVPDRDGDGAADTVMIHSLYRPDRAPLWSEQVRYAQHAIEHHSRETGLSYPWPHMTSVEGDGMIGGGMEFPMLTLIGPYRGREAANLYGVTAHELGHMWTPMILGSNEKRYAWMDEGFATYLSNRAEIDYLTAAEQNPEQGSRHDYLAFAARGLEEPMMRHGDAYTTGYGIASYAKPATLLVTLRNLLGEEVFERAIHAYFQEWAFKHPSPWDLFATFERAAGHDLDWFWSSWYYTTWRLDHAVAEVRQGPDGVRVRIADRGWIPMPAIVRIETSAAGTIERTIPVSHWLGGATWYDIELPASVGQVSRVQLDPERLFPDADRDNDVWPAKEGEQQQAEAHSSLPGRAAAR